jgi:hypothetical protein
MTFRWIIAIAMYTLLIGPVMDVPSTSADTKAKPRFHTTRAVANR